MPVKKTSFILTFCGKSNNLVVKTFCNLKRKITSLLNLISFLGGDK